MTAVRFLCLAACAAAALTFLGPQGDALAAEASATPLLDGIRAAQAKTWRYDRIMGRRLTPSDRSMYRTPSRGYRRWLLELWRERAEQARLRAMHPPHQAAWLCIHAHEGPWRANTGNGYYGGLQMDISFQRTYGSYLLRTRAMRTAGRRSSRCGSPSARTGAAGASIRGRTRPGAVGSCRRSRGGPRLAARPGTALVRASRTSSWPARREGGGGPRPPSRPRPCEPASRASR